MKVVKGPDPIEFTYTLAHDCGALLKYDLDDIEADWCKKPGTYWFDGSADRAPKSLHFFAKPGKGCPCGKAVQIPDKAVPRKVQAELQRRLEERKPGRG